MKKILGLDLGSNSIGWAVITTSGENDSEIKIEAAGSRIIPLSVSDSDEFTKGQPITKNADRTQRRTQRKGYDRYQLRRANLTAFLAQHNMRPSAELVGLSKLELWQLRAKAVNEKLALPQIGRVLYHINQKRGYKSAKGDGDDKTQREYVENIINRYKDITQKGVTVGELFFDELSKKDNYRVKEQIFPRKAYVEEFNRVMECQKQFYPQLFTDDNIAILRDEIIFYQRALKSCKHLVSICDFQKREYKTPDGRTISTGPKVAPQSSPIAQTCKVWESVNNITLKNRRGAQFEITLSQRQQMFDYLDNNERLTLTEIYKILGINRSDGWNAGIGKGIGGNNTKAAIRRALGAEYEHLMKFNLKNVDTDIVNADTGEVLQVKSTDYLNEPLYRLWHTVYSIKDRDELARVIEKQFGLTDATLIDNLYALDFVKAGYANKSAKAMCRILPYLELGLKYSEACLAAGFRHSQSLTKAENESRVLLDRLQPIAKNELRQPVVEKILNQMINVVNALMEKHGRFDEIRVELARELKQSKDERKQTTENIGKAEKVNKTIAERIAKDYNLTPTRSRIQKYKMWEESGHICFYCSNPVNVSEFLRGFEVEVEHILPRALYFDDSFSNKVCACRKCNHDKGKATAYDFMCGKSAGEFEQYLDRVESLYKAGTISRTKHERLLTPIDKIPTDFVTRQLHESRYIASKSREILQSVCRDVTSTSGSVTSFIRHIWGWDRVLENINFDRYKAAGLTVTVTNEHKGGTISTERIKGWTKRDDHRHHAIDALVIACTKQCYIQLINNMSEIKDVNFAGTAAQNPHYQERMTKLERYIYSQNHFSTIDVQRAVEHIFVSFKSGKRSASIGKRYIHRHGKAIKVQDQIIVPRGALHEESLYGSIDRYSKNRAGETIIQNSIVIKYPITSIAKKDIEFIVDGGIKELIKARFDTFADNEKQIWKDLEANPFLFNGKPVRSVRCFTGLKAESTAKLSRGVVKLGNNHHIAIYTDKDGKRHESCVTFWHAAERKKFGVPIIITDPDQVWANVSESMAEQFLGKLPRADWNFELSIQQNEMFILGMEPEAFGEAMSNGHNALLSKYLYRVQKIATKQYYFRSHIETTVDDKYEEVKNETLSISMGKLKRVSSIDSLLSLNPVKVKISLTGEILKL